MQHSWSRRPCLPIRYVAAPFQLLSRISDPHCPEHPPVSLLRQLRRELSPVQRVWPDVPPRHDARCSKLFSTNDNQRLRQSSSLAQRPCRRCRESWNASEKYPTLSAPTGATLKQSSFTTSYHISWSGCRL